MKASIIIPTYKRPKLLRQALNSAAAVRYPPDEYEVVVVNDGGPGVDRKRVRSWWRGPQDCLRYARIRHGGLSAAVNRALELARAELCTVLPDDDTVLPNKLEAMVPIFERGEVDVAYSLPRYFGAQSGTPARLRRFLRAHPVLTWAHIERGDGLWVHGTATMYRTRLCREIGGWDTKLKTGEEYEFHLRLLQAGHDFHAVDAVTTGYRVHPGGKSVTLRKNRSAMRRYILNKLRQREGALP